MWQLARVHLRGVGPDDARFDPLTLDLRGSLGPAHTVLWLANGGGKTTLLRLLFHVLSYSGARKIGKELPGAQGALAGLLGADDVGHIVLEWVWSGPARRLQAEPEHLITALVCARRPRTGGDELLRSFYSLGPDSSLNLERLCAAMVTDGHRTTALKYLEWLRNEDAAQPAVRLTITDTIRRWEEHLLELGVDPALFRYQIEMNHGEGGADGLLSSMRSARDVVAFLLRTVVSPESLSGLDEEIDAFVEKVARQPALERELRFVERLRQSLERLHATSELHTAATRSEREARSASGTLRLAIEQAAAIREQRALLLEHQLNEAGAERASEDQRRRQALRRAGGLERWIAQRRYEQTRQAAEAAAHARAAAEQEHEAWVVLPQVTSERAVLAQLATLRQLIATQDAELEPVRDARDMALTALLKRLDGLVDSATAAVERLREAEQAATTAGGAAAEQRTRAQAGRSGAQAQAAGLQRQLEEVDRRRRELRAQQLLSAAEEAAAALSRHASRAESVREKRAEAERSAKQSEQLENDARAAGEQAQIKRERGSAVLRDLEHTAAAHEAEAARLRSEPLLAELLEREPTSLDTDGAAAIAELSAETARCDAQWAALNAEDAADQRDLEHIAASGVLPPSSDAMRVISVLRAAKITADHGAAHVAGAVPLPQRADALRRRPWLPAAVVVSDPRTAAQAAQSCSEELRQPVLLTTGDGAEILAAVPGNAATWDDQAAQRWARATQERQQLRAATMTELQERSQQARDLRGALAKHLSGWSSESRRAHEVAAGAAREELAQANAAFEDAQRGVRSARTQQQLANGEMRQAHGTLLQAEAACLALEPVVQLEASAEGWRRALLDAEQLVRDTTAEIERYTAAERAATARVQTIRTELESSQQALTQYRTLRMPYETRRPPALEVPMALGSTSVEELQQRVADLDAEINRRASESQLQSRLEEAERRRDELGRMLASADAGVVKRAQLIAGQPVADDALARQRGLADSMVSLQRARDAAASADSAHALAQREWHEAQALTDTLAPDPIPVDLAQAQQQLRDERNEQEAANTRRQELDGIVRTLEPEFNDEVTNGKRLRDIAGGLEPIDGAPDPGQALVEAVAEPEIAAVRRDDVQREIRSCTEALAQALAQRDNASNGVSDVLQDPDYEQVGGQTRRDLLDMGVEQRASRAAELCDLLRQRAELIADTLQTLHRDRTVVATTLAKEVDAGIRLLARVESASRLPAGLGPWTDQRLLRFYGLTRPRDLPTVIAKVEDTLNRIVRADQRPRGVELLIACVCDIVDTGTLSAAVLKPNAGEPGTPEPVANLPMFSGGQRATVAILLYTTLARMRAGELHRRGQQAGVGVLMLDNPLGKASAGFLVDQQLLVASANGIQLIYATGVGDFDALDRFPNRIRLRNRALVGRALRRVVDEQTATELLGQQSTSSGLEAVRHYAELDE